MIDNTSYLLVKQHVKAGEKVKIWSQLLLDWFNGPKAPDFPEDGLFSLYEVLTEDNKHKGWRWELENKLIGNRTEITAIDEFIFAEEAENGKL